MICIGSSGFYTTFARVMVDVVVRNADGVYPQVQMNNSEGVLSQKDWIEATLTTKAVSTYFETNDYA